MRASKTSIVGVLDFDVDVHTDRRGLFSSPFQGEAFRAALGRPLFPVAQISHNRSARGVLRGLHFTAVPPGGAKFFYAVHGRVRDFLVDLRTGSPTFGRWSEVLLGPDQARGRYIPPGIGHAFYAEEEDSVMVYVLSREYRAANELALSPRDPDLGLPFPDEVLLSERDAAAPGLAEARDRGLLPEYRDCLEAEEEAWH
ncbi:dTDP-4-dehydrorhamnose 3,5-epimerase family protein [Nocardiopsis halophila]|uniref:dTDP-4-dehydrorhamnose 3,5-epimerase family protein n=1 Tax=Nocardiopsis halophila TaxID=141692 RepID=UPI000345CA29|nr:dTDP-4-dehydrorhamnose 3,5-epimerase family protein [Nocardiopsis halophila]